MSFTSAGANLLISPARAFFPTDSSWDVNFALGSTLANSAKLPLFNNLLRSSGSIFGGGNGEPIGGGGEPVGGGGELAGGGGELAGGGGELAGSGGELAGGKPVDGSIDDGKGDDIIGAQVCGGIAAPHTQLADVHPSFATHIQPG